MGQGKASLINVVYLTLNTNVGKTFLLWAMVYTCSISSALLASASAGYVTACGGIAQIHVAQWLAFEVIDHVVEVTSCLEATHGHVFPVSCPLSWLKGNSHLECYTDPGVTSTIRSFLLYQMQ